jgi:TM2 domain-containing membrane protein YozV
MNEAVVLQRPRGDDEKYCRECGSTIRAKAEICPHCGVRQMVPQGNLGAVPPNGKNRIAAALLAFFLGAFGVHKFYLGQVFLGILYLVFCWTFIPAFIAFVEFVLLLIMSDDEFARKYGTD